MKQDKHLVTVEELKDRRNSIQRQLWQKENMSETAIDRLSHAQWSKRHESILKLMDRKRDIEKRLTALGETL